jgi:hypothetical protein
VCTSFKTQVFMDASSTVTREKLSSVFVSCIHFQTRDDLEEHGKDIFGFNKVFHKHPDAKVLDFPMISAS